MSAGTILLVEDNPITRKMLHATLETEGYDVVESPDGKTALALAAARRPDLLILDDVLPDMDGQQLLAEVGSKLGTPAVPAIVITGMASRLDDLRTQSGGSTQVLAKPVAPSQLLEVVRAQLAPAVVRTGGQRVLVVDHEPLNLKLAAFRLERAGYEVETASGGEEALEIVRRRRPDAILTAVMMPSMDGFSFCREARRDPTLGSIPIVLVSSAYVDEADRDLALRMCASALVVRTPDLRDALAAIEASLRGTVAAPLTTTSDDLTALHRERVQVQLERQTARNETLIREAAIQATALSIMTGLSEVLAQPRDVPQTLGDVLVHCMDAAGLSTGLLYLTEPGGQPRLQAQFGIPADRKADAEAVFGHPQLMRRIVESGNAVALSSRAEDGDPEARDFLARLGYSSVLVLPFVVQGETFGELVLASENHDLSASSWIGFARSLAQQFAQTVALGQSLKRLAASESRHRALMDQANDAIFVLNQEGVILEANQMSETLLGLPRDRVIGRNISEFAALPAAETPEYVARFQQALAAGGGRVDNVALRRGDGALVEVDFSMSLSDIDGNAAVLSIGRDVTERTLLQAQLVKAQKMEAVGQLAGGVAHDFNNLLGVIKGYSELLMRDLPADSRERNRCEEINRAADRAAALTRQLLAFSRRQVLQPKVLDLNEVVTEVEKMLRRLISESIQIVIVASPGLGKVRADAGQIEQVLVNLAINARDAMPSGGRLVIETGNVELDEAYARMHPEAHPGPHVMLAVSDTGHGMDAKTMSRIFEPFFTTKEEGKGTGLGLATAYGIVRQSGGTVNVYSEPGHGTTLKVYLPRVEAEVEVEPRADFAAPPGGTETILLVEDADALRLLVRELLESAGYTVLDAEAPDKALSLVQSTPGPIHLVLTDMVMPRMNGQELATRIATLKPEARVVFMSGYSDQAMGDMGTLEPGALFLQKPFTMDALMRTIRRALDAGLPTKT